LRDRLPHDQLEVRFHRDLCVVGLQESIWSFHDARLGIREVELVVGFRPGLFRRLALALGLGSGPLFQRPLGLADLLDPRLPSCQLGWQFVAPKVSSITRIFILRR
jgi:hypothetical protein